MRIPCRPAAAMFWRMIVKIAITNKIDPSNAGVRGS